MISKDARGEASPVIGVILMIALALVLLALIFAFAHNVANHPQLDGEEYVAISESDDAMTISVQDRDEIKYVTVEARVFEDCEIESDGECTLMVNDTVTVQHSPAAVSISVTVEEGTDTVYKNGEWV